MRCARTFSSTPRFESIYFWQGIKLDHTHHLHFEHARSFQPRLMLHAVSPTLLLEPEDEVRLDLDACIFFDTQFSNCRLRASFVVGYKRPAIPVIA